MAAVSAARRASKSTALLAMAPPEEAETGSGETETLTLSLSGMWCSSCSWAIEETLDRTPGVEDAEVSFVRREARVSYDPAVVDPKRLKRGVRRLGYRAWLPADKIKDEEDSLYYRMLIGFVLTMQVMMISLSLYAAKWLGWWDSTGKADIKAFLEIILLVGAVPVVLLLGLPILKAGLVSLIRGSAQHPHPHRHRRLLGFRAFGSQPRRRRRPALLRHRHCSSVAGHVWSLAGVEGSQTRHRGRGSALGADPGYGKRSRRAR